MSDDKDYRYDVFISYRWVEPDQSWVRDELKPALENAGLEVCLDVDDFVPGSDVILEMTRASTESRRGLCVLSPDYVNNPDRMVNFESLMLRGMDPSGNSSRLIPFILRRTDIPAYIRNLIAIDWTDARHRPREWAKLLDVLEAKNREAPPPPGIETDPNQPQTPTPPPITPPRPRPSRRPIPRMAWIGIAVVALLGVIGVGYKACSLTKIEGTIYYKQPPGSTAMLPVEDVEVFLAPKSTVKSKPTGPDGKFVLRGVPLFASSINLIVTYGLQDFTVPYDSRGVYAVIPPDLPKPRKFISCEWIPTNEECVPDEGRDPAISKVYQCDVEFPADAANRTALLTVALLDLPETTIRSAHVLSTPPDSYSNETAPKDDGSEEENKGVSRTWRFDLSKSGLKIQLLVCVGSDNRSAQVPSDKLSTYYSLQ